MTENLILYSMRSCPFCVRVLSYLEQNGINIEVRDTMMNPEYRQELMTIGGKTQVPCLVIDGSPLYESNDIIDWFENNAS